MHVKHERTVQMPTDIARFKLMLFTAEGDPQPHVALALGHPESQPAALVRVHSECLTGDVFGSQRCDCGAQLDASMRMVAAEGAGLILYMRQEGRGIGLKHKIHAYALQESGLDTVEANVRLGFDADMRDYETTAEILKVIGVKAVRLITNNPAKIAGLERHGIKIAERVPLVIPSTPQSEYYLQTKKEKMGHLI